MNMPFNLWMKKVDNMLENELGQDSSTVIDFNWNLAYEYGDSPREAVDAYLEDNDVLDDYEETEEDYDDL